MIFIFLLKSVAKALLADSVPSEWNKRWEGPEKPQLWLRELTRKRASVARWKAMSTKGSVLDEPICLGDLFNPATFINALRQQTARQLSMAIDRVKLICGWDRDTKEVKSSCLLPCTLSGLYLQGATFHGGTLRESASDENEISSAPNAMVGFVASAGDDRDVSQFERSKTIGIPLYLSPNREELLVELRMPIDGEYDRWVLAGVAIFMSEDE